MVPGFSIEEAENEGETFYNPQQLGALKAVQQTIEPSNAPVSSIMNMDDILSQKSYLQRLGEYHQMQQMSSHNTMEANIYQIK